MVLCLAVAASAQTGYKFPAGYLEVLGGELLHDFNCIGRSYGYYADVSSDCQVFHVCLPITTDVGLEGETSQFSFFCGNQTVFNQETLTCAYREDAFPCSEAETLYESSNANFGVILRAASSEVSLTHEGRFDNEEEHALSEEEHEFQGHTITDNEIQTTNDEVPQEITNNDQGIEELDDSDLTIISLG